MNFAKGSNNLIFCRHRKCRTKLKTAVSDKRAAFCSRGCHTSFYLSSVSFARGRYDVKTRRKRFAENRSAAMLGGPEPVATSNPPLLASLQKALILLGRNRPSNPTEPGTDSWPETVPLATILRMDATCLNPASLERADFKGLSAKFASRRPCDTELAAPKKSQKLPGCALPFSQTRV